MKPMRKINREMLFIAVTALVALLFTAMPVLAKVKGPCVGCHTMHNSQDGASMSVDAVTGIAIPVTKGANGSLLRMGCIACHSSATNYAGGDVPFVYQSNQTATYAATGNTSLAGGNFYFGEATANHAKAHNVNGIAGPDDNLGLNPPGYSTGFVGTSTIARAFAASGSTNQLTCAGTQGCHGDPNYSEDFAAINGAHHGTQNANGYADGTTTTDTGTMGSSYRFLFGIRGIEHAKWEYQATHLAHNQYYGIDRADNDTIVDKQTISHFCCECHGNFHAALETSGTYGASPFNRHPTDFDMSATNTPGEYLAYNNPDGGGTSGQYSTLAPVASTLTGVTGGSSDISGWIIQNDVFTNAKGDSAIVNCISCHRAHGSEFDDLLRWDYNTLSGGVFDTGTEAGTLTGSGCFVCHTTKDDI